MTGEPDDGVLVVDDDADIREILVEVIEDHGYRASGAANGLEALQRLRGGMRPCLILLDLMMPVMNGPTFRAEQRRDPALAGIPVVVLSAYRGAFDDVDAMGAKAILDKPVDLHRILRVIEDAC
jgi:CheY-like chemotaxis protein